jgi:hypothetical protein
VKKIFSDAADKAESIFTGPDDLKTTMEKEEELLRKLCNTLVKERLVDGREVPADGP